MLEFPKQAELTGICYFNSTPGQRVIPNVVGKNVFYVEVVQAGEVFYGSQRERHLCRRGTILWHQAGEETVWQRTSPRQEFSSFAMLFRIVTPWERPGHIGNWHNMEELDEFILEAMRRYYNPEFDQRILASYLLARLTWEFYCASLPQSNLSLPLPLVKAMTLLENGDVASRGIAVLAHDVQLSEAHLHTLFQKHLGTTPHQYLLRQRLKRARVLLAGTNMPVKEIGVECGFQSAESFFRAFRKEQGLTPAQFRKRGIALLNSDILHHHVAFKADGSLPPET